MLVSALSQFRLTMSMITSRSLAPTTKGRTMQTIENGNERMRNTAAAPFANTKNLHATKIKGWYLHLISVAICDLLLVCISVCQKRYTYSDIAFALALMKRKCFVL